jgi:hypothetical protein
MIQRRALPTLEFNMKVSPFRVMNRVPERAAACVARANPGYRLRWHRCPAEHRLDHNALYHALKKEAFHSSILDLEIDGKVEQVLLRDFQSTLSSNWSCTWTSSALTLPRSCTPRCPCTS